MADYVGGQDGGEAPLDVFFGHTLCTSPRAASAGDCMGAPLRSLSDPMSGNGMVRPCSYPAGE